ncbi:MAG: hypothetical protein J2P57_25245, partial [Acidimicrobiaceae bacterium]|nr:hypothetical protein [Acidimicrobiaceae bacterium]
RHRDTRALDHRVTSYRSPDDALTGPGECGTATPRLGGSLAGTITHMFDFNHPSAQKLFLNPQTGEPLHARAA